LAESKKRETAAEGVLLPGVSSRTWAESRSVTMAVLPRGTGHGTGAGETLGTQGILGGRDGPSVQAGRPGQGTVPLVMRRSSVRFR